MSIASKAVRRYTGDMDDTQRYSPSAPIILGLTGSIASGKTVTAQALAPTARVLPPEFDVDGFRTVHWDALSYALPLHEMATIRRNIEGDGARDRQLYEIHTTLLDVFGASPLYGAPPYDRLVEMVHQIADYPISQSGKPRKFLQYVGTEIIRAYNEDTWVTWMDRKIRTEFNLFLSTRHEDSEQPFGVIIDDVRMHNEAEYVKEAPNGLLVKLWARPDVIAERVYDRDGAWVTDDVTRHESEVQSASIPDEWCTAIVDTSDMSVEVQVATIREIVVSRLGGGVSINA